MRETMAAQKSRSDSVALDMNQKQLLLAENAPLAKQESLEEEEKVINITEDKLHNLVNGDVELSYEGEEDEESNNLHQIVVIPEADAECEVSSIRSLKPQSHSCEIKGQMSTETKHTNIHESPVNEPIILVKHKAQVLQDPVDLTDNSALEKFQEFHKLQPNDVPHRRGSEEENYNDPSTLKRSNFSINKDSPDLIVTVENNPDEELKVTEKLPEVLLVAEQLPERLKAAKNILARASSKEKEPTAPPYESSEIDDAGSTLTLGRGDTVTELTEILQTETGLLGSSEDRVDFKTRTRTASENESCISPFFIGIYSFLAVLIVIMIGLNFWFGFHLLFFIGLLAVIALFSCVLTEFNDFHNEPD